MFFGLFGCRAVRATHVFACASQEQRRYEGLLLKSPAIGPFGFEVWLHSDGRILLLLEEFPVDNLTALAGIQAGVCEHKGLLV